VLNTTDTEELERRGIAEVAVKFGVTSSTRLGGSVKIPYLLRGKEVNAKYRDPKKAMCQEEGGRKCLWNIDAALDPSLAKEPLIITEGEYDAFTAIEAGFSRVVSVPDGAPAKPIDGETVKYDYLDDLKRADIKEIIICADGDDKGANLLLDLSIRLGRPRCKFVKYPKGCKDLNEALMAYGVKGVTETIKRAEWCQVEGIYRMSDLPPIAEPVVYDVGIPCLRPHLNLRKGDFSVWTGIPSHGKTTFVNDICCHMAEGHKWTIAIASFEQYPQTDFKRNLRTWHSGKFEMNMGHDELAAADEWIDKWFSFIVPHEDEDVPLEWVLEKAAASIIQHGADMVVIDPWNEMDHVKPKDMSLTEYTGFAIKQFRKLARKYQVHVAVVAHPTKLKKGDDGQFPVPSLYNISDSAAWYNKADLGVVIHQQDGGTLIRVAKSRYHQKIGIPGDIQMSFDPETNRFSFANPLEIVA
jgi:twinkle protein